MVNPTFTLLSEGELFEGRYRIISVLEKDTEGSSFQVMDEKEQVVRHLKVFHQAFYDNVNKLFGSHFRLSKLKHLNHPTIARVYEVSYAHSPYYMVTEYISGHSLADIKLHNPDLLTEAFARKLFAKLVEATAYIHKSGLSVINLTYDKINLTDDDQIKIHASGISYDTVDEREDIFNLGMLVAKVINKNKYYNTLFDQIKSHIRKFEYIPGISLGLNKVLADCLHRNINQRYSKLAALDKAFQALLPLEQDEVYHAKEVDIVPMETSREMSAPAPRIDIWFWSIIAVTLILIGLMVTTNIMDTIFGQKNATLRFTGLENLKSDTTSVSQVRAANDQDDYRRVMPLRDFRRGGAGEDSLSGFSTTFGIGNKPAPKAKSQVDENMVFLPSNTFAFGSLKKDARDNVSINGFYISKSEVTQDEYNKYMKPSPYSSKGDNLPVDNVSWFDAIIYCNGRSQAEGLIPCYRISGTGANRVVTCDFKANGYRLPTEAEWEYAAKGTELSAYSGSDDIDEVGWYRDNSGGRLHPVKSRTPNYYGLYDMSGNVSEWCWDWYDPNYTKSMPFINPTGPDFSTAKVIRGGNISHPFGKSLSVVTRDKADPNQGYKYIGFRVVRSK